MPYLYRLCSRRAFAPAFLILPLLFVTSAAGARVVYVNQSVTGSSHDGTSWTTAFTTVQAGINAASSGDEMWVAKGTYQESVTLKAGTGLYGGFSGSETSRDQRNPTVNPTVLDATKAGGSVVTAPGGCGRDTVLDGFVITGGTGTNRGLAGDPWRCGGGVICLNASPTISNCTITGNAVSGDYRLCGTHYICPSGAGSGGGLFLEQSGARLLYNTISSNSAWNEGGGIHISGGAPLVCDNVISDNTGERGGGVICKYTGAFVQGNAIQRNTAYISGGGMYVTSGPTTVVANQISNNQCKVDSSYGVYPADGGQGSAVWSDSGSVTGCVLVGNTSTNAGSALWLTGTASAADCTLVGGDVALATAGAVRVTNCTVASNRTGVSVLAGGEPSVTNCIVAFNETGIARDPAAASPVLSHNDVCANLTANYTGIDDPAGTNGNISLDPRLSGLSYGVHLKLDSPCIDAGDDAAVTPGQTDVYGKPRVIGAHVDIGSDESDGTDWAVPARILHVVRGGSDGSDGLTWDTAKGTVAGALNAALGGDEVWVARGSYPEAIELPLGVSLYGGFAGNETNRYHRDWAANATVFNGGTIHGTVSPSSQGGILDGVSLLGGLDIPSYYANIGHCIVGPPGVSVGGTATISDSRVYGGTTGITVAGTATIRRCTLNQNGTGVLVSGAATIEDTAIWSSISGIDASGGAVTVKNCTLAQCSAYGICAGTATVTNSIIAFNGAGMRRGTLGGAFSISHCDVYGNAVNFDGISDPAGSLGNISADPRLAYRSGGDLHLLPGSPAIDSGDDSAFIPGDLDLDGKPRIIGPRADMGAYEYGDNYFTVADAVECLKVAAGLDTPQAGISYWDVAPPISRVDILDAVRIARKAAGLDANP